MAASLTGVILINVGTPDDPTPSSVGKYLREFLMDPYVIDIPAPLRWILVNLMIVPRRSHASSELYQKIWDKRGSPLKYYLEDLVSLVQNNVGPSFFVAGAMRYQSPSIENALKEIQNKNCDSLFVIPLYPQYSLAATETSIKNVSNIAKKIGFSKPIKTLNEFYERKEFLDCFTHKILTDWETKNFDHLLFSFHGLPERQVKKTDPTQNHCLSSNTCCDQNPMPAPQCYRAQCFRTAHALAKNLGLTSSQYSIAFQSRLGRTPWIKPYTDHVLPELAKAGKSRLLVASPAFVTDCLETLEEIQIRSCEAFIEAGGKELKLVPSLNADPNWAEALSSWIKSP